jgi:hypothetical protein
MKSFSLILTCIFAVSTTLAQQISLNDSLSSSIDSARYLSDNFNVLRSPYAHGNATFLVNNRNIFGLNAGVDVFNVIRGQMPNLEMGPAAAISGVSLRGAGAALVIDGAPMGQSFSNYYNLNSSEYEQVTVISSNSNVLSGSSALNGATLLTSRTGQGYENATFEFNSYSTLGWYKPDASPPIMSDVESSKYWNINNGIAYMQDFGKVDTRVSFNHGKSPVRSIYESNSHNSSVRINTGFDLDPKLNFRLILDRRYSFGRSEPTGMYSATSWTERDLSQGTLLLNLVPTKWAHISFQHTLTEIDADSKSTNGINISNNEAEQNKKFHKALLTFLPSQGRKLNTTVYIGVQQEDIGVYFASASRSNNGSMGSWSKLNFKTTSTVLGSTLSLGDYLFADLNFRRDKQGFLPDDDNNHDVKTGGLSFVFAKAFGWESKAFSMGRIRTSFGHAEVTGPIPYPYTEAQAQQFYAPPSSEKSRELGLDVGFANNRLTFSVASFKRIMEKLYFFAPLPPWGGGSGSGGIYANIGEYHTSGWELSLGASPIRRNDIRLDTKLIWVKNKSEIKSVSQGSNGDVDFTNGNPTPDWNASLLNQFSWKKVFVTCLIDVRKGGDIGYVQQNEVVIKDGSYGKIRELGIGIQLSGGAFSKWGVNNLSLSLTGRNLVNFYSPGDEDDAEEFFMSQYIKSVSAGLHVTF